MKKINDNNNIQKLISGSVILIFILSLIMIINGYVNNSQSEGAFLPAIRLIGEYKVGDGEWKTIDSQKHIPATKGDVQLRGVLEFGDFEANEIFGLLTPGTLVSINLNHINLSITQNGETIYVSDTENPYIGEDACGNVWQTFEYTGEDGYIELTVHNNHKYGNEAAVDELLSSMNVYIGDYFEKIALDEAQAERLIAITIIIAAFIVLGIAIFSSMLYKEIFRKTLFSGMLILSAGLFFLFTSKAFCLWFDKIIINTMISCLSAMIYLLFAILLIKDIFSEKLKTTANITTLIYTIFITVLTAVSVFSKIYFYDMIAVWVIGASVTALIFIVLSLLSLKDVSKRQKFPLIFFAIALTAFLTDIVAEYFALWQTASISEVIFLAGFVISVIAFLRIFPENIKAAKNAEKLEKEKITLDAELAQSRISTLMSQIHPHFIYNTLGSIEQLCELDPPKAAKLVNDFSKYLRGNFREIDTPKLIRVSKELEHTQYYISIEKVRFPDIEFITEMTCLDFSIPALTIQPIVENAVKHGILKREEGGTVKVRIYETEKSYCVSVKDNGVGFDVIELEHKNHIGLRNIKARLEAMCEGILHIESIIGVGTKITVEIPKEAN